MSLLTLFAETLRLILPLEPLLLLSLLVSCSLTGLAQDRTVQGGIEPSLAKSSSQTFIALGGRFTIALPEVAGGYQPLSLDTPMGALTGNVYTWRMAEGQFNVMYLDRPQSSSDPNAAKLLLEGIRQQAQAQAAGANGKLVNETPISLSGHPGHEFKIEFAASVLTLRLYMVGDRVYQLLVSVPRNRQSQDALIVRTLDSFKLLTGVEVENALKKRMAESTPAPLPQRPSTKRPRTDAEEEGLKGRTRIVASESEDLSGKGAVSKRKPSTTYYYNQQGNLTKTESYDYMGNPSTLTVYGYIDADRVSNTNRIRYEYDPPPAMVPAATTSEIKRDPRYASKYKYKYDDRGNLVEKVVYGNDAGIRLRYVYKYEGSQREELVYSADGSLNQRYRSILDALGNVLERTDFNAKDGSVRKKYSYIYEFDSKGNWIRRVTSEWVTRDGKAGYEPASVMYRTITYN